MVIKKKYMSQEPLVIEWTHVSWSVTVLTMAVWSPSLSRHDALCNCENETD